MELWKIILLIVLSLLTGMLICYYYMSLEVTLAYLRGYSDGTDACAKSFLNIRYGESVVNNDTDFIYTDTDSIKVQRKGDNDAKT